MGPDLGFSSISGDPDPGWIRFLALNPPFRAVPSCSTHPARPRMVPLVPAAGMADTTALYTSDIMDLENAELALTRARIRFAWWLGAVVALGLLLFFYHYLGPMAEGEKINPLDPFISEMTGALTAGVLYFGVRAFVMRFPLDTGHGKRALPLYLVALVAFAITHTSLMWATRLILFPIAGLGPYHYGRMPIRYFMEAPMQIIVFTVMVAAIHGVRHLQRTKEQEIRNAQLESNLARAELRNLRLQLQPHFLFNALNTISATMYDDPAAADEMLDHLSELLRTSLRTSQTDEVPLATDLGTLDCYLSIMRARFGERLAVSIDVPDSLRDALVPSMFLQPLVENAIRHGNAERQGHGAIRLRADESDGLLVIEIADDGPGVSDTNGEGVGLSSSAERLRLLYGKSQSFTAGPAAEGGFVVTATIPLRRREERAS